MTMKGVGKKALSTGMVAAVTTMLALALTPTGAAAGACAKTFKKCGCTISAPGSYTLVNLSTFPLKSTGTCIDITASNVTLNINGPNLGFSGPGTGTPTVGIDIEPSANNVSVAGLTPNGFGVGVRIDGSNALLYYVNASGNQRGIVVNGKNALILASSSYNNEAVGIQINKTATNFVMVASTVYLQGGVGIELNQVSGAAVVSVVTELNGTVGIWLNGASNNVITGFESDNNGIAGVYLGCNAAGPNGQASCPSDTPSNGNAVLGVQFNNSYSTADNSIGPSFTQQSYGIAVGLGNLHNDFLTIEGDGNTVDDALDENPNCGSNRWLGNIFTTSDPAQNTTDYCIN